MLNRSKLSEKFKLAAARSLVSLSKLSLKGETPFRFVHDQLNKTARKIAPSFRSNEEQEKITYHEIGHALLCELLPGNGRVFIVNFMGGGKYGGFVGHEDPKSNELDYDKLMNIIAMTMGGLVMEEIK